MLTECPQRFTLLDKITDFDMHPFHAAADLGADDCLLIGQQAPLAANDGRPTLQIHNEGRRGNRCKLLCLANVVIRQVALTATNPHHHGQAQHQATGTHWWES